MTSESGRPHHRASRIGARAHRRRPSFHTFLVNIKRSRVQSCGDKAKHPWTPRGWAEKGKGSEARVRTLIAPSFFPFVAVHTSLNARPPTFQFPQTSVTVHASFDYPSDQSCEPCLSLSPERSTSLRCPQRKSSSLAEWHDMRLDLLVGSSARE